MNIFINFCNKHPLKTKELWTYAVNHGVSIGFNIFANHLIRYRIGKQKMGLSSSQARLLSLTARMHDIEYRAQRLEAQKLQLANESDKAYANYLRVLDAKKVQCKHLTSDGSITFIDATYQNLIERGYQISFKDFGYGLSHEDYELYKVATENLTSFGNNNKEYFAALRTGRVSTSNPEVGGYKEVYTATQLLDILNTGHTGEKYRLMADIDLSGKTFTSHNITNCEIDGNGHSITGITTALFDTITNSSVSNLRVSGNVVNARGILANTIEGTLNSGKKISNVIVSGSIESPNTNSIGGLAGTVRTTDISHCSANVNIKGAASVGGFIGDVVGANIDNCSSSGTIDAIKTAGGFVANATNGTKVSYSSSNTIITTNATDAVTLGLSNNDHPDSGGFIGMACGITFDHCVSRGSISDYSNGPTSSSVVGGFLGCTGGTGTTNKIEYSDSYVNVSSAYKTQVVGFGSAYGEATEPHTTLKLTNCNSYGTITYGAHCSNKSGLTYSSGYTEVTITDCYTSSSLTFAEYGQLNPPSPTHDGKIIGQTTNATSPITNSITVESPNINIITQVNNSGADEARDIFNTAAASGRAVFDMSNQDPFGLSEHKNDNKWLSNLLAEGYIFIHVVDNNGELHDVSVSIDTGLQEVDDEKDLRKAEAQYEADMRQIDKKDRRYDTELAAVDAERNAVKQELDTLKNVAKDNVDRTFKLFS